MQVEETAAPPAAAFAALNASSVLAAPQADTRKSRRLKAEALCVRARRLVRETVGGAVRRGKRHRQEFAVGGSIKLDRQPAAFGIN